MAYNDTRSKRQSLLMPRGTLSGVGTGGIPRPSGIAGPKLPRPTSVYGMESYVSEQMGASGLSGAKPRAGTSNLGKLSRPQSTVPEDSTAAVRTTGGAARPAQGMVARSQSLRKPAGHTRGMSASVLAPGAARQLPKPAGSQPQSPIRSPTENDGMTSPSRSKLPAGNLHRTGSTSVRHNRTNSSLSTMSAGPGVRPTSMMLPPSSRPAFSTLQQHYSPKRTLGPKPTSASLIHNAASNGSPNGQDAVSGSPSLETNFMQAHLLQLTCLHASFYPTFEAWCASTRKTLRSKFADTASKMAVVNEREMESRARRNVVALAEWGRLHDGKMDDEDWGRLGENIQTLASVVRETTVLLERGGRATVAVGWFADWVEKVERVWGRRQSHDIDEEAEFVEDMGAEWRNESAGVLRRLSGLRRMLEGLEKPAEGSTVHEVMGYLDDMLKGAIEEMETVVAVEKVVMKIEKDWVDEKLNEVLVS